MRPSHLQSLNKSLGDAFSSPLLNRPIATLSIGTAPKNRQHLFRTGISMGVSPAGTSVDRTGGDSGAGLIAGFAVCTIGEVKGQGLWCDSTFLSQVYSAIRGNTVGLKSRFTHSIGDEDALGSFLGRAKNPRIDGDTVRADLHFDPTAHKTPAGDLAAYLMDLALSDPKAFGASVLFERDSVAEQALMAKNGGRYGFNSPDAGNVDDLPHVRLKSLFAVDFVDDPAANPNGLFSRGAKAAMRKLIDVPTALANVPGTNLKQFSASLATEFASRRTTPADKHVKPDAPRETEGGYSDAVTKFAASIKLPS